jgi:hypothetical protein
MAFTWRRFEVEFVFFANDYRRWTKFVKCAAFDDIIRGRKEIE